MKAPQSALTREILADEEKAAQLVEAARTGSPGPIEINGKVVYLRRVRHRLAALVSGTNGQRGTARRTRR